MVKAAAARKVGKQARGWLQVEHICIDRWVAEVVFEQLTHGELVDSGDPVQPRRQALPVPWRRVDRPPEDRSHPAISRSNWRRRSVGPV
ncbi:hypothetical protein A5N78_08105 [Prescottella equi]|nr:hypothetical protein A5N78_08105 [Prescottella equi]ORM23055.1 hypothetical protein A5N70_02570 [Prescottella equi]